MSVAIAGATNAGKSSLFNALLRQDRAIVSDVHGTTRDWLEGTVSIEGIPVRLFDTAGLRASDRSPGGGRHAPHSPGDGVAPTRSSISSTAPGGLSADDRTVLDGWAGPAPLLRAWNKTDLPQALPCARRVSSPVSATTGAGVERVERRSSSRLPSGERPGNRGAAHRLGAPAGPAAAGAGRAPALWRRRGSGGIAADLLAVDLADALDALGEITGAVTSAEILDRMFSRFCVGK